MAGKAVLAIGLDPEFADFSAFPDLTPALIRTYIDAQVEGLRALGYDASSCWVDRGATAERAVEAALRSGRYDCVLIGAGLREPLDLLVLFEKILNLVHVLAPGARIAFNANPADTAEAVARQIGG